MGWFSKSPFGHNEDPVNHMVKLLSDEAEKAGSPLTQSEKEYLAAGHSDHEPPTEGLEKKTKDLIVRIFEAEPWDEFERDPKSFGNSLQWAGDSRYSNIVALAEEVSCEMTGRSSPPLHGWQKISDRILLVGCGILVVLSMFAIGAVGTIFFGWK